ncbi:unnamed protein product [Linum tenue]|uniref:Uncharacterized protein n=1 Tax=Linum tenue TaxID=586396 RepID=A0AAV0IKB8_9ROSI|nr:unnamed protein product [Linum tenue]
MAKDGPYLQSDQFIIVYVNSVVIRSAKPYLATPEAIVHGHEKILYEGDTLRGRLENRIQDMDSLNS